MIDNASRLTAESVKELEIEDQLVFLFDCFGHVVVEEIIRGELKNVGKACSVQELLRSNA